MFTAIRSLTAPLATPRRTGLIGWLLARDAAFREARRMERLTETERRDMGLPAARRGETPRQVADRRFLTGQW